MWKLLGLEALWGALLGSWDMGDVLHGKNRKTIVFTIESVATHHFA